MTRLYIILLSAACLVFGSCESNEIQPRIVMPGEGKATAVEAKETAGEVKAAADGKAAEAGREALPQRESPQDPNGAKAAAGELKKESPQTLKAALAEYKKAKNEAASAEESIMREITGLIIEETMTRIGYDFYECFFMSWEAPQGIKDYNILITERANPMWGSWVQVEVNGTPAWSTVVKPRHDDVEEAAKDAIEAAKEYLRNYDVFRKQLQSEDMSGDGI